RKRAACAAPPRRRSCAGGGEHPANNCFFSDIFRLKNRLSGVSYSSAKQNERIIQNDETVFTFCGVSGNAVLRV
ncbi:MAG: hypothetical protein IJW07_02475, partial [Lentisphaeria bacterium]|nr:hypothetical protein [Lentisphaeria bacterium]